MALLCLGGIRADDEAEARSVVDRAMKAMGGETKLSRLQTGSAKGKVTGQENGQELTFTFDGSWHGRSQYRLDGEASHGGQAMKLLVVINGDKGWAKVGDRTEEAPAEILSLIRDAIHTLRTPQLLPGLKEPAYKLSHSGEVKIGDRAAVGLLVAHKDHKDLNLYFDKENGLPLKSEIRMTEPGGKEITAEFHYSDYKEFDGVKHPAKVVIRADDKELTMHIDQVKAEEKPDESLFAKP
jgi:hypothetical protein